MGEDLHVRLRSCPSNRGAFVPVVVTTKSGHMPSTGGYGAAVTDGQMVLPGPWPVKKARRTGSVGKDHHGALWKSSGKYIANPASRCCSISDGPGRLDSYRSSSPLSWSGGVICACRWYASLDTAIWGVEAEQKKRGTSQPSAWGVSRVRSEELVCPLVRGVQHLPVDRFQVARYQRCTFPSAGFGGLGQTFWRSVGQSESTFFFFLPVPGGWADGTSRAGLGWAGLLSGRQSSRLVGGALAVWRAGAGREGGRKFAPPPVPLAVFALQLLLGSRATPRLDLGPPGQGTSVSSLRPPVSMPTANPASWFQGIQCSPL